MDFLRENLLQTYYLVFGGVFTLSVLFFLISLVVKKNSIADIFWGLTFIFIALLSVFSQPILTLSGFTVFILVLIWGSRLAFHIYLRNKGKKEDKRYLALAKDWGRYFYLRSYFQVFLLQGVLAILVSTSVIINAVYGAESINIYYILGLIVWIIGFLFESIGDAQLKKFLSNSQNLDKIMDQGLWKYTRHPNYFGEITMWWGIFVITLAASDYKLLAIIGPITITLLITKVSGIPMLEKQFVGKPGWDEYKQKTSVLIPWIPKK